MEGRSLFGFMQWDELVGRFYFRGMGRVLLDLDLDNGKGKTEEQGTRQWEGLLRLL